MSKHFSIFIFLFFALVAPFSLFAQSEANPTNPLPSMLTGSFTDDYGIRYEISDSLWTQYPDIRYHILSWNIDEKYLLAYNDDGNTSDSGLYTRIDFMSFENMEPFKWGFCLTTYNASTLDEARDKALADRQNPRIGCSGHPFSRMKRTE